MPGVRRTLASSKCYYSCQTSCVWDAHTLANGGILIHKAHCRYDVEGKLPQIVDDNSRKCTYRTQVVGLPAAAQACILCLCRCTCVTLADFQAFNSCRNITTSYRLSTTTVCCSAPIEIQYFSVPQAYTDARPASMPHASQMSSTNRASSV